MPLFGRPFSEVVTAVPPDEELVVVDVFDVELVVLGKEGGEERAVADRLYNELRAGGLETVYEDRDAGPGEKFADAELLGCPLRVTVGRRALAEGHVEVQVRRGRETHTVPVEGAADAVGQLWQELP